MLEFARGARHLPDFKYQRQEIPIIMKMLNRYLLLLLLTVVLTGCAELAKHAETIKPTAELTGASLAGINFEQADLVFDLAIDNRNPVDIDLAGLNYDFKIDNHSLLSGVAAQGLQIKRTLAERPFCVSAGRQFCCGSADHRKLCYTCI